MLTAAENLLLTLLAAVVLWAVCYVVIRGAFRAVEVYRAAREWAYPSPRPYRVVWNSPAGEPPWWLAWRPWGSRSFTAMVHATDADAAVAEVEAAYLRATGYPDSYRPVIVQCKEVVTPLGDGA